MKKNLILSLIILMMLSFSLNVKAQNVSIEEFYQSLENNEVISEELFRFAQNEGLVLGSEEYYSEVITNYNEYTGEILNVFEREITKEEYENYHSIQTFGSCGTTCHETNAKKFTMNVFATEYISVFKIQLYNVWKTVPKVKSYDTIAARWEIGEGLGFKSDMTKVYGEQRYCVNSSCDVVYYDNNSSNIKIESNGAGVSMNIVDSATSGIENLLNITVYTYNSGILSVYGTYQHATSNISLSTAKSYSFGNGLGGTLVYSTTNASKFDNMQGILIHADLPI